MALTLTLYVMAWAPTTDQILNLDGVRQRVDRFRFELCDQDLNPIGELHPDRSESVPRIQNDTGDNTSRRLSNFKLLPDELKDVNTLSDRVRVYMQLQNGAEFRMGTFLWASSNEPERSWGREQHSELVDYSHILSKSTTRAYGWERGATITLIMFFLLFEAGFSLDQIKVIGPEAQRALTEPMSWQPGVTWVQMLTDLGKLVGFAPPWLDRDGNVYLDKVPDPAVAEPTVPPYDDDTRIIADSILHSDDFLAAPNEFAVFDSGTDRMRLGRYALPASAPHSFQNRGFRDGKVETVQGLEGQTAANEAARNLARDSDVFEWITFSSTLDPRHDTYDIVPVFGRNWLETSWEAELRSGGEMKHTCKRVTYEVT